MMGAISLFIVGSIIELLICFKTGRWICWPSLWLASDISQFDTLVRISALSPLIDIVETVSLENDKEKHRLISK